MYTKIRNSLTGLVVAGSMLGASYVAGSPPQTQSVTHQASQVRASHQSEIVIQTKQATIRVSLPANVAGETQ